MESNATLDSTARTPEELERLERLMHHIFFTNLGMGNLALEASDACRGEGQAFLQAVQDMAKINARRLDVLHSLLTGRGTANFGNFRDELDFPAQQEADHA